MSWIADGLRKYTVNHIFYIVGDIKSLFLYCWAKLETQTFNSYITIITDA